MLRSWVAASAGCALVLSLTGCVGSTPETAGTAIELPGIATDDPTTGQPEPAQDSLPPATAPDGAAPSPAADPADAQPTATSTKDCVIVAAGVSSILLAPLSFLGTPDEENVERLHDQIDDLRSMVPPTLADDFDRLQDVVTASTRDGGSLDEGSYRAAVVPIEEWLHQHCGKSHR